MRFESKPSFIKQMKKLQRKDPVREKAIRNTIKEFCRLLFYRLPVPTGFGLTKLKGNYWELRVNLSDRVVFYKKGDLIRWILAGNHQEVREFLKPV